MSGRFDSCTAMRRLLKRTLGYYLTILTVNCVLLKKIPDLTILPRNNRSGPALRLSILL